MLLLDGKTLSSKIKSTIASQVNALKNERGIVPHLAAILIGGDGASETYVAGKIKSCREVGFLSSLYRFSSEVSQKEIFNKIDEVNNNPEIHGLIVQLPLPKHISSEKINERISPQKDVDGFHPLNAGKMLAGLPCHLPATPFGIMLLLKEYHVPTEGKNCVILGRSHIVGRPMSMLLSGNSYPGNCTVTLCHSKTKNLQKITAEADILIVAMGIPGYVTGEMVKEGVAVIDVGITRVAADNKTGFRLQGDVKFEEVSPKSSFITPVPGGVGPMTIAALMLNTLKAATEFLD